MDPIRNSYTPNAGSRLPELAGRDQELEQIRVLVGRLKRGATEGLVYATEDYGHVAFTVTRFDEFMRRYMH